MKIKIPTKKAQNSLIIINNNNHSFTHSALNKVKRIIIYKSQNVLSCYVEVYFVQPPVCF